MTESPVGPTTTDKTTEPQGISTAQQRPTTDKTTEPQGISTAPERPTTDKTTEPQGISTAQVGRVLHGQVAVVTGAGQGIGAGIASALAAAGAAVVIATRRAANGEPAAESIRAAGHEAVFVRCDVTQATDVDATVAQAVERFGGLDIMVHNAVGAAGRPGPVHLARSDLIRPQIATATTASFLCAKASLPHLRRRPGTLILLTSPAGVEGSANLGVYATVKATQRGIVKSLAREWGPDGVRVNAIAPVARTPAMNAAVAANPDLETRLVARTPLGRLGDPAADIGPVAVFLASEGARYITGQTIVADGGGFLGL